MIQRPGQRSDLSASDLTQNPAAFVRELNEQLQELQSASGAYSLQGVIHRYEFFYGASNAATDWPAINLPFTPIGVVVVGYENETVNQLLSVAPFVQWEPSPTGAFVRGVAGLPTLNSNYVLNLLCLKGGESVRLAL